MISIPTSLYAHIGRSYCALSSPCELYDDVGRDTGKVTQSSHLCVFVSVYKGFVSVALLKQSSYLFFGRPKHQS